MFVQTLVDNLKKTSLDISVPALAAWREHGPPLARPLFSELGKRQADTGESSSAARPRVSPRKPGPPAFDDISDASGEEDWEGLGLGDG